MLLAAVRNEYRIASQPTGPQHLRKVTFSQYKGAVVPEVDAALEPGCTEARCVLGCWESERKLIRLNVTSRYIEAAHRMFRSNAKTLEGNILYTNASQPLASLT